MRRWSSPAAGSAGSTARRTYVWPAYSASPRRRCGAAFFFFVANLSFYLVMTLFMNAAGVAAIGAVLFATESLQSARAGFVVSLAPFMTLIMICAAFLAWMRRAAA